MHIKYRHNSRNKFTLILESLSLKENYTAINQRVIVNSYSYEFNGNVLLLILALELEWYPGAAGLLTAVSS